MREVQERLDARLGAERMATLRTLLQEVGDELGSTKSSVNRRWSSSGGRAG